MSATNVKVPSIKELFDHALYFGHRTQHWNPKFKEYIWGEKGGIHVIDLNKTHEKLKEALEFLASASVNGQELLVVGSKTQARTVVKEIFKGGNIHYVSTKWLPGLLTNYKTIKKRITYYNKLIDMRISGEMNKYSKKEIASFSREIRKLDNMLGGVLNMTKVPDIIFIVDIYNEKTALREAQNKGLTTIAMVDSNSDPDEVNYPIPANDDSKKSIEFILNLVKDTWNSNFKENKGNKLKEQAKEEQAQDESKAKKPVANKAPAKK